jgi:hypothetical protein
MSYIVEHIRRIYSAGAGYYWEVRPDGDGLGLEVVYNEGTKDSKDQPPGAIDPEAAKLIAQAIIEVAEELEKKPC